MELWFALVDGCLPTVACQPLLADGCLAMDAVSLLGRNAGCVFRQRGQPLWTESRPVIAFCLYDRGL